MRKIKTHKEVTAGASKLSCNQVSDFRRNGFESRCKCGAATILVASAVFQRNVYKHLWQFVPFNAKHESEYGSSFSLKHSFLGISATSTTTRFAQKHTKQESLVSLH